MTPAAVTSSIDQFNVHLAQSGGDLAAMAKGLGLVDHVGQRDLVRQRLIELTGEDEKTHSFHGVGYRDYLRVAGGPPATQSDAKVAVLVAKGTILNGQQPLGTIGGDSAATLIRRARHDDDTKALVLRVDSGGGSAFASEVIRRELELLREAGKPVVVSMGSYAASGGYWIATSSDEIWASPTTVTGSIGIFGFFPTFQNPLKEYLGVQVDGVGTAWLSEVRPDLEMPEAFGVAMQAIIEKGYRDFLDRVGGARDMTREEVNLIAQGRVWSGLQAKEIGLVDQLGDLDDAIASAAVHAGLGEDYGVEYLEKELDFGDQLLIDLLEEASVWQPLMARGARRQGLDSVLQRIFSEQVETFSRFDDPMGMYAHCLCEVN
jgi:protease-4